MKDTFMKLWENEADIDELAFTLFCMTETGDLCLCDIKAGLVSIINDLTNKPKLIEWAKGVYDNYKEHMKEGKMNDYIIKLALHFCYAKHVAYVLTENVRNSLCSYESVERALNKLVDKAIPESTPNAFYKTILDEFKKGCSY